MESESRSEIDSGVNVELESLTSQWSQFFIPTSEVFFTFGRYRYQNIDSASDLW